ncbi:MATH and LRR domain-containing protein PFE0570w-like isoform X8 [Adelges cooleyi]|uniref:MATH and LRR domain-containing protein PFE0570w-like isoform X8 n=1 Tax=Adelges cooleyi TaxID=133065 RepID=UPI002180045D|nr:MATH and LRR domain-containing protein PFE0570w-like isoform X8 [Adelges cooleyi]
MWRFLKVFKCLLISCSLICLHQNEVFSFKINPKDVEKQWSVLVNSTEQPGLARTAKNCGTSINRFYDELDNIKNQTTEKLAVIKDTAEVKNLAVGFKKQVVSSTTNLNDVQRNVYKLAGHFKDKYKNGLWGIEIDSQNTFDKLNEMKSTPVDNTKSLPGSAARMFGNRHDYEKLSNKILSVSLDDQQLMDDLKKKRTKARAEFSSLYNALDKWTKNVNNIAFETMDVFFKGISSIKSIKRKVKEFKEDALSKIDENELAAVQNAIELAKALKFIFKTQITHDSNEIFDDEPTADDDTSTQADDSNEENNINKENKSIPKNEIQNQKSLSDIAADSTPRHEPKKENLDLQTSNESTISNSSPNDTSNVNDTKFSPLDEEKNNMTKNTPQENPNNLTIDSVPTSEPVNLLTSNESIISNASPNDTLSDNGSTISPLDKQNDIISKQTSQENPKDLIADFTPKHKKLDLETSNESNISNSSPIGTLNVNDIKFSPLDEENNNTTKNTPQENPNGLTTDSVPTSEPEDLLTSNELTNSNLTPNDTVSANDTSLSPLDKANNHMSKQTSQENPKDFTSDSTPKHEYLDLPFNSESTTSNPSPNDTSSMNDTMDDDVHNKAKPKHMRRKKKLLSWDELIKKPEPIVSSESNNCVNALKTSISDLNSIKLSTKNKIQAAKDENELKVTENDAIKKYQDNMKKTNSVLANRLIDVAENACETVKSIDDKYETKFKNDPNLQRVSYLLGKKYDPNYYILQVLSEADTNSNKNGVSGKKKPSYYKMVSVCQNLINETNEMDESALYAMNKIYEGLIATKDLSKEANKESAQKALYILRKLKEDENEEDIISKTENHNKVQEKIFDDDNNNVRNQNENHNSNDNLQPNAIAHNNKPKVPVDVDLGENTNNKQIAEDYPRSQEVDDEDNSIDNLQPNAIAHKNEPKVPVDVDLGDNTHNKQIAEDYPRSQEVDDEDDSIENLQPNAIAHKNEPKVPVDVDLGDNTNNKQIAEDYPRSQEVDDDDNSIENLQPNAIAHKNEPKVPVDVDLGENTNNKQIAEDYPRSQEVDDEDNSIDNLQPNAIAHKNEPKVPVDVDLGDNTNNKQIAEDYPRSQEVDDEDNSIDNLQPNAIAHKNEPKVPVDVDLGENTNNKQIAEDYPRSQEVDDEDDSIENLQPNAIAHKNEPKVPVDVDLEDNTHNKQIAEDYPRSQEGDDEDKISEKTQENDSINESSGILPGNKDDGILINASVSNPVSVENIPDEGSESILHFPETAEQPRNEMDPHHDKIATNQVFDNAFEPSMSTENIEQDKKENPNLNSTQNIIPKIDKESLNKDQENDDSELLDSVENAIPSVVQNKKIVNSVLSSEEFDEDDGDSLDEMKNNKGSESILHSPETAEQPRNEMDPHHDKIATDQVFDNAFKPSMSTVNVEQDKKENPTLNSTQNIIPKIDKESLNKDQENDDSELLDSVENAIPSVVQNKKIVNSVLSSEEFDEDDGDSLDEMKNNKGSESILHSPETAEQPRNEMDPHHDKIATDQVFDNAFKPSMSTENIEQDKKENPNLNSTQNIIPKIDKESLNKDQENDDSELLDSVENAIPSVVQNKKIVNSVLSSEEFDKDDGDSLDEMKNNKGSESILHSPETAEQPRNEMDPHHDKIATDQVFDNAFKPSMSTVNDEQDKEENPNLNSTQNIIPKIDKESLNKDQENDDSELLDSVENAIPSVVQNKKIVSPVLSSEEFDGDDEESLDQVKTNTFKSSSRPDILETPNLNGANPVIPTPVQEIMPNTLLDDQISTEVKLPSLDEKDPINKKIVHTEPYNEGLNKGHAIPDKNANIIAEPVLSNLEGDSSEALLGESIPKINKEIHKSSEGNGSTEVLDSVENVTPSVTQNENLPKSVVSSKEYEGDQPGSQDKIKNNDDKENVLKNLSGEEQLNNKIDMDNNNRADVGDNTITGDPTEVNHDKYELPSVDDAQSRLHDNELKNSLESGDLVKPEQDSQDMPGDTKYNTITEPIHEIPEINGKEPLLNKIPETNNENLTNNKLNNSSEITNNVDDAKPSFDNQKIVNPIESSNEYNEEPKSQAEPNNEDQQIITKIPLSEEQPNNEVNAGKYNETPYLNNETVVSPLGENMSEHIPTEDDLSDKDRIFSPVEGGSNNSVEFDKQPRDGNRNELESPLSTSTIAPDFVLINDIAEEMPPKSEIESNADEEKPEVPFEQPNKNDGKKVKAKRYRKRRITYLINKTTGKRTAVKEEIIPIDTDKTPKVSTENEIVNQDEPKNADEIDNQDEPKTADEIDNQDEPKTADKDDSNLLYNSNAEQCKITAYEELTKIASYDIKKLVFSIGLLSSKLRNNVMSDIKQANNDVKQSDLRGQVDQVVERTRKAIDVNFEQSIGEMREKLVLLAQKFVETTNGLKNTYKVRPRTTHEMLSSITVDPLPVSETAGAALSIISPQFNIDKAVRRILEARPSGRVKNLHDKKYDTQRKLIDLSRLMDTAVNNFECLMLSVINEIGIGVDTLKVLNSSKLMMSSQNPRAKALKNAMTIVQEILGRASGNQSGASAKFANRSIDSEPVADMKNKQKPVGVIVVHPDMTIRYKQLPGNKELKKFVAEESKPYKKGKTKVSPKFLEVDNKKLIQNIINDTKKRAKQAGMTDAETVNEIVRKLNTKH